MKDKQKFAAMKYLVEKQPKKYRLRFFWNHFENIIGPSVGYFHFEERVPYIPRIESPLWRFRWDFLDEISLGAPPLSTLPWRRNK